MKLKTSFFNRTIFLKNVTLYWPLWGLYTLLLMILQPIILWLNSYYNGFMAIAPTPEERFVDLMDCLYMNPYLCIIWVAALIFGMALFSYMYSSKSANMVHSLPVDRKELFGTNVISGLAFLIVPQVFTAIITLLVCAGFGIPDAHYVFVWLVMSMATAFIAFSMVTICAMLTGLILALPVYVAVANGLAYWVYGLVLFVISVFGYGVNDYSFFYSGIGAHGIGGIIIYLSPMHAIVNGVDIYRTYQEMAYVTPVAEVEIRGLGMLAVYAVMAVVLYFLAYKVYKKRQIEQAGDLLTVSWLKPVFRWGIGTTGGIFGGLFIHQILNDIGLKSNLVTYIILMLILGGLCYFFADMFVKKSFHVFKKKNWIGCGKFSIVLVVLFFGLFGLAKYEENYVPDADKVTRAEIIMGYSMEFAETDAEYVTQIHEKILDNLEACKELEYDWGADHTYIQIEYELENGKNCSRSYRVPLESEEMQNILEEIYVLQTDPDVFMRSYLMVNKFENPRFSDSSALHYLKKSELTEEDEMDFEDEGDEYVDYEWVYEQFTEEIATAIYEAAIADTKAGTLMKYNFDMSYGPHYTGIYLEEYIKYNYDMAISSSAYINLAMYNALENGGYDAWKEIYIGFGPDCENIINTLIEYEIIKSVDDILWE